MRIDREIRPCLRCGHAASAHAPVPLTDYVTHDGALVRDMIFGPCGDSFIPGQVCFCERWIPDELSHVSELLGLDVRQVILTA